jgi:hypothetical protein
MKNLHAFDLVILGYLAVLSAVVVAARPEGAAIYLTYHALGAALIALLAYAHARFGGRFWTFCRYWYVVPLVLASFRELHYLVPAVHPFDDAHFDRVLGALDRRWFGDLDGGLLRAAAAFPLVVDLLHVCYWFYFASMLITGGVIYARSRWGDLREYVTVLMAGFYLSYLGYLLVPAVGPHHFYPERPAALDGWILGRHAHAALMTLEWRMPDAFPSGHALMSMLVIGLAWRYDRTTFRLIAGPAAGCVVATVALRYHYLVDVLASVAILPVAFWGGTALHRAWERRVTFQRR